MKANKRTNTKPEIKIRSALHRSGLRFRKDFVIRAGDRRIRPDIVFTKARLAVFIDGCFWHLCPKHGHFPKSNCDYWEPKLKKNSERDILDSSCLSLHGWNVLRLWEHVPPEKALQIIHRSLAQLAEGIAVTQMGEDDGSYFKSHHHEENQNG